MNIAERQNRIINILAGSNYVTVEQFSKELGVSKVTIRSDLSELEKKGLLFRTHGGAMVPEHRAAARILANTITENEAEKRAIAERAAAFIEDGMTVIVDSGSTTVHVVKYLSNRNITLVTNSVPVIEAARFDDTIELMVPGGFLRRFSMGFIGPVATAALSQIHADIMFLGCGGYTDKLLYCSNLVEGEVKKSMMKASDRVCFLADSTKYGKKAFSALSAWDDIDVFVTDSIDELLRKELEGKGIEVAICRKDAVC